MDPINALDEENKKNANNRKKNTSLPKDDKVISKLKEDTISKVDLTPVNKEKEVVVSKMKNSKVKKPVPKVEEVKKPVPKVEEVKKLVNKVDEVKKPVNKVDEVKKPVQKFDGFKKPANKVDEVKKPVHKVGEVKKPVNKVGEVKKPVNKVDEVKKSVPKVEEFKKPLKTDDFTEQENIREEFDDDAIVNTFGSNYKDSTEKPINVVKEDKVNKVEKQINNDDGTIDAGLLVEIPEEVTPLVKPLEVHTHKELLKPSNKNNAEKTSNANKESDMVDDFFSFDNKKDIQSENSNVNKVQKTVPEKSDLVSLRHLGSEEEDAIVGQFDETYFGKGLEDEVRYPEQVEPVEAPKVNNAIQNVKEASEELVDIADSKIVDDKEEVDILDATHDQMFDVLNSLENSLDSGSAEKVKLLIKKAIKIIVGVLVLGLISYLVLQIDFSSLSTFMESDKKEIENVVEKTEVKDEKISAITTVVEVAKEEVFIPRVYDFNSINPTKYVFSSGRNNYVKTDLAVNLVIMEKMVNLYEIEVYSHLEMSNNREVTLNNYIVDLDTVLDAAKKEQEILKVKTAEMKGQYLEVEAQKNNLNKEYFSYIDSYNSYAADKALEQFVEINKVSIEIKAKLLSLERLEQSYMNMIPIFETRLIAIKQNKDAFINNVKVVDFEGVDLNIIQK